MDAWKEANEGQAVSDTKKALFEAESNYEVVAAAVKASGAELEQLQKFAVSAPEVTAALQAVVLAAGHESPDALKGGPYKTVDFGKVRITFTITILNKQLFCKVSTWILIGKKQ